MLERLEKRRLETVARLEARAQCRSHAQADERQQLAGNALIDGVEGVGGALLRAPEQYGCFLPTHRGHVTTGQACTRRSLLLTLSHRRSGEASRLRTGIVRRALAWPRR